MKCEDCQQETATVHFTQIVNDETETFHLCSSCAQKRGLKTSPVSAQVPLSDFLSEMGAPIFTKATSANLACPRCGCSFRQFRKSGRLGCAHCYLTFEDEMSALLRKIHGSADHVGIVAGQAIGPVEESEERLFQLRRDLRRAVDNEAYEQAARLRDEIAGLEEESSAAVGGEGENGGRS